MRAFARPIPGLGLFALLSLSLGCTERSQCDESPGQCVNIGATDTGDDGADEQGGDEGEEICVDPPQECLRLVECVDAIAPEQRLEVEQRYGAEGSCWCGTVDEINACYTTCLSQLDAAITNYPTESACHPRSCELDELNRDEPYGPVEDGSCPTLMGLEQIPLEQPLGLPGSVCAPPCAGIAQTCWDHSQTVAAGTCMLTIGDENYCVARCWVNSAQIYPSGTQCQCGATCQPHGGADGEGNLRGICTFE